MSTHNSNSRSIRSVKKSSAGSDYVGSLPMGCKQCILGQKLVLFVTGLCPHKCYYCPLSAKRKNVDKIFADEVPVKSFEDVVMEARLCGARGAGITGGDPIVQIDRTVEFISKLKKEFGERFHIHLYTSGDLLTPSILSRLDEAGLDEIRLHLRDDLSLIDKCFGYGFEVGAEVPIIPEKFAELKKLVLYLEEKGAKFLNLNELEMADVNFDDMIERGHESNDDIYNTVKGSRETGLKILNFAASNTKNLSVHLCTSQLKYTAQYSNRLARRAKSIARDFEKVVDHCLIEKGVVEADESDEMDEFADEVVGTLGLEERDYFVDIDNRRIDMSVKNVKRAALKGFNCAIVKVLPTVDGFDVEKDPL